jgi:interferon gamma-inducible protein 30
MGFVASGFMVVLLVLACSTSPVDGVLTGGAVGRVKLSYYVEAYCARCIDVLTNSLHDAMKRVGDIVDLEVVPFGNGEEKNGRVTCQHGVKECHANTLQGCAQKYYPSVTTWFPFIVCMEKQMDPLHAASYCARKHKIDYSKIEKCAKGDDGKKILYANARKTLDLQPPNKVSANRTDRRTGQW